MLYLRRKRTKAVIFCESFIETIQNNRSFLYLIQTYYWHAYLLHFLSRIFGKRRPYILAKRGTKQLFHKIFDAYMGGEHTWYRCVADHALSETISFSIQILYLYYKLNYFVCGCGK